MKKFPKSKKYNGKNYKLWTKHLSKYGANVEKSHLKSHTSANVRIASAKNKKGKTRYAVYRR